MDGWQRQESMIKKIGHQNLSLSKPLDVLQDTQQILVFQEKFESLK